MEKRQQKAKQRYQHYTDRIRRIRSRDKDNISQAQAKAKEWISHQPEKVSET